MDKFSSNFLKKLIKTVKDSALLTWGGRVVAAVSGGVDSVVLLFSLYELRRYFGINIACASFDHKIRASSGEDILFVAGLCKKFSIPFYTESKDVKAYAKDNKLNLEEAARILRYGFLTRAAADFNAEKLAVAHHLDDFAENFIIRLITGGGAGAIAGIPVKSGSIIRPFINHTKSEILDFARKNSVPFREDYTNNDTRILRNFVRQDIMPKLKERNPSFLKTVCNTSEILKKDDEFIAGTAFKLFKDIAKPDINGKKIVFAQDDLSAMEEALLYRLLKISVSGISEGGYGNINEFFVKKTIIYYKHFKAFIELIKSKKPNAYFNINSFIAVRREYDKIIVEYIPLCTKLTFKSFDFELKNSSGYFNFRAVPKTKTAPGFGYNYSIKKNGAAKDGGAYTYRIKIEEINKTFYIKKLGNEITEKIKKDIFKKKFNFEPNTAYFDYDKITFPVVIRPFKEGDRLAPLGMKDDKKLKEYFIDKKVPANIRKIIPIVIFGDKIAWVSFNVISDNIKLTESTVNAGIMGVE
ncbi:MAG: tRNA lysidine(34) synthetase TilS [bacterium]